MIAEAQGIRIRHRGHEPQVHPTAYVAPTATLVGDVRVGPRARVMYGAVLDAEGSRIEVGEAAVICENAVLRGSAVAGDQPVLVDDHVFVGPHATLLGCEVGRCVYVATAATVLQCARLGAGSVVAVGALVHARTVLPDEYFVPPHTVALDAPVRLLALAIRAWPRPSGGWASRRWRSASTRSGPTGSAGTSTSRRCASPSSARTRTMRF